MEPARHGMHPAGSAKKVTIFVGHYSDSGKHSYLRILEYLQSEGAAGATAFKAIAAFGARARVHTVRLADVAPDLPVMIVWIDTAERVERLLPTLSKMIGDGLITVEDTEVLLYTTQAVPELPRALTVRDVMTRDVVSVRPDTPMSEVVADLVEQQIRSVPVVDVDEHVVGIITNGDLMRRGGLPVRLNLLHSVESTELRFHLRRLAQSRRTAGEVMTSPAITIEPSMDVPHAAEMMCRRKLKRLPVVDGGGRLIGIVSRLDLLGAVTERTPETRTSEPAIAGVNATTPVARIMTSTVPVVSADAPLQEVIEVVLSTRLSRAVVIDEQRHVLGIITDGELIERLNPEARPGLRTVFTRRLPFVPGSKEAEETFRHLRGTHARDVMVTDIAVAREDDSVRDVLAMMLSKGRKIVPILNAHDKLVGMVDRAALLQVLITDGEGLTPVPET